MSGPKVSVYALSAEQRQNLRGQLNCLQQSLVCCEEIKKSIKYLNGVGGEIQSLLSTFEIINARSGDCSSEISVLADYRDALPQDCRLFLGELEGLPVSQVNNFNLSEAELAKRKATLAKLRNLQNRALAKHKEIETALPPMAEKAKQGAVDLESAIADDVSGVQSFFVMPQETEEEKLESEKKKVEEQLHSLTLDSDCPNEFKSEILSAFDVVSRINGKEQLTTFQAVTLRPLQNRIEVAITKKQEEKREYEELRTRFDALRLVAGGEQTYVSPDYGDTERLKIIISDLEKCIVARTEQAYISDCVNAVMSDMGYDIIGERDVVKKSGRQFSNELFSYGDGTAINVTYDSGGQIAMELGGIDRSDRIPTAEETDVLREDMENFCSDFKDFEERLKEKGVMIKSRVSMSPPSAEYATIINLTDYNIKTAAPIQEIAAAGKRKKAAAKRTMQKEDKTF